MNKKLLTLCIIQDGGRVLLGKKKRGFGEGRWNGFGGKVMDGERIEEAARRETEEECGLVLTELEKRALLTFYLEGMEEVLEVHVFHSVYDGGEVVESEEMAPKWFYIKDIPYDEMWQDDVYWLPRFLEGERLVGEFRFDKNDVLLEHELKTHP